MGIHVPGLRAGSLPCQNNLFESNKYLQKISQVKYDEFCVLYPFNK